MLSCVLRAPQAVQAGEALDAREAVVAEVEARQRGARAQACRARRQPPHHRLHACIHQQLDTLPWGCQLAPSLARCSGSLHAHVER